MSKKLTQEYVKNIFENKGCLLLSEYINNSTPLYYKCSCGNATRSVLRKFVNKTGGCRKCRTSYSRLNIDYVKGVFEDNNCKLLEKIYINSKTKMKYICQCGNISEITFNNFQRGNRCYNCGLRKLSNRFKGERSVTWNPDRESILMRNITYKICKELLRRTLRLSDKGYKSDRTENLLGYSKQQLLEHLKKDPNFDSWKNNTKEWHIDHIIPVKAFTYHKIIDPKIINALDNLRIIHWRENCSKSDIYCEEDLKSFLEKKGSLKTC